MGKRIRVADLPEFDAARYLNSETAIAAYLTDILEANDAALLADPSQVSEARPEAPGYFRATCFEIGRTRQENHRPDDVSGRANHVSRNPTD